MSIDPCYFTHAREARSVAYAFSFVSFLYLVRDAKVSTIRSFVAAVSSNVVFRQVQIPYQSQFFKIWCYNEISRIVALGQHIHYGTVLSPLALGIAVPVPDPSELFLNLPSHKHMMQSQRKYPRSSMLPLYFTVITRT